MTVFTIGRIHTSKGIFRLSGRFLAECEEAPIELREADIMATDGWQVLDLEHPKTISLFEAIQSEIISHLMHKQSQ